MRFQNDNKLHFKMYKSGKTWLIAGILSTAVTFVMLGSAQVAKADTTQNQSTTQNDGNQTNTTNGQSNTTTTTASDNQTATTNGQLNLTTTNPTANGTTNSTNTDSTTTNTNDNTTNQTTPQLTTTNANSTNQNSTKNDQSTTNAPLDSTTSSTDATTQNNGVNSNRQLDSSNGADLATSATTDPNLANNLKLVNGKYTYVNSDGTTAKSTLIQSNDKSYYFDKDGNLTDLSKIVPTIGTDKFTSEKNNAIYANSNKYITNTDGFITASSWYRPKKVLQNGTKWTASKAKDFRPLLSVWWPNKTVQLNYVKYMNQKGLGSSNLDANSSQAALDAAVKDIRKQIEKKIYAGKGSVAWLKKDINSFIKTQPEWNLTSEEYNLSGDGSDPVNGFQGGTIVYKNSNLTPDSNSNYRLLGRTPSKQTGKNKYPNDYTGYEMLLANDVDNSNPVVQAEDLNWLYYLMNFGTLTKNDPSANFDSIRVDAVDNMDADLLNIASKYFNLAYKVNRSEKNANNHISILEDWSPNDPYYLKKHNSNQITIDVSFRDQSAQALFSKPSNRGSMSGFIKGLVNRSKDYSENKAIPNYSMVRAHDNGVQDAIAKIINDHINPKSNGYIVSNKELNEAFKIYNKDQKQTNKQYTQYNIPSSYALMLTNKDTIPRVYYGDVFTDNGQFMAKKSIYYTPITSMMDARIKYVAGGQSINVVQVNGDSSMPASSNKEILTSVRYGKGALSPNDKGGSITRKSGIAVIESNDPNLKLSNQDKVVINMGAAHKNQAYRPLIDSSQNGLVTYNNDSDTSKVVHTDSNGNLTLTASEIAGYSNPQESGYLSMWVPVGAAKNQDIRTAAKNKKNKNGRIVNSNAALDSNLIFEGFSNFQSQPSKKSQYENVVIPKKMNLFKQWGVTYMQLPPQYRSVGGNEFTDTTIRNGYAFNDRYDLGFKKPTKYGTADQLINTIKKLHRNGIKVMADFVPDQLYSMPNQQVVNASKSDIYGNPILGSNIYNTLYVSNTKGGGKDYQAKFGGKFLKELKRRYPSLFNTKQISTGKTIDASKKIKTWTAKYFNGTNIQGKGAYYVLSNIGNSGYFAVKDKKNKGIKSTYLPKQLSGQNFNYGVYRDGDNVKYITPSGYNAQNGFYQDPNGQWYYFDKNGNIVTQPSKINDADYYFLSNGINLRNFIEKANDGKLYYYNKNGVKETVPGYYSIDNKDYFYAQKDGSLLIGLHEMPGANNDKQFFNNEGTQIKGQVINVNGKGLYLDPNTGSAVTNGFVIDKDGNVYYAGKDGYFVTGVQIINGDLMYFSPDGKQVKGQVVSVNGKSIYLSPSDGSANKNGFVIDKDGNVYYSGPDGYLLTGLQTVNGHLMYFYPDGRQAKGQVVSVDGKNIYLDANDGYANTNGFVIDKDGNVYYSDSDGYFITGQQTIDGNKMYFYPDGKQAKNQIVNINGINYYYGSLGRLVTNQTVNVNGTQYTAASDGSLS